MKNLNLFLYEWTHFIRSPFKVIAVLLFVMASVYGLHNGANLYHKQEQEIEHIKDKVNKDRKEYSENYTKEEKNTRSSQPILALWFNYIHQYKKPESAMVYSIGQAEQYGFYKLVNIRSSPYDSDMTQEIANPERLNSGTIDFAFSLLFLMPLTLLILLYNIRSLETEQGFINLIEVQNPRRKSWLLSRMAFYFVLTIGILILLILYGATLTHVFKEKSNAIFSMLINSITYLFFWSALFYFILSKGKSIIQNSLIMIGSYVVFAFLIPATVNQYLSIKYPTNLMTDLIDVRDERWDLYDQDDSVILDKLYTLIPDLKDIPVSEEHTKKIAKRIGNYALVNELMKTSALPVEEDSKSKNQFIQSTFWFNPVSFYQNKLNRISKTHYQDYVLYRNKIQKNIDEQIRVMLIDTWKDVKVDEEKYNYYHDTFSDW